MCVARAWVRAGVDVHVRACVRACACVQVSRILLRPEAPAEAGGQDAGGFPSRCVCV